jgi:hypothetical protein
MDLLEIIAIAANPSGLQGHYMGLILGSDEGTGFEYCLYLLMICHLVN